MRAEAVIRSQIHRGPLTNEQQKLVGKDAFPGPDPDSNSTKKFLISVLSAEIRDF